MRARNWLPGHTPPIRRALGVGRRHLAISEGRVASSRLKAVKKTRSQRRGFQRRVVQGQQAEFGEHQRQNRPRNTGFNR